jgi:hypothetical protein
MLNILMRDMPVLSLEKILHKDYESKRSVVKKRTPVMVLKRLDAKTAGLAVNSDKVREQIS